MDGFEYDGAQAEQTTDNVIYIIFICHQNKTTKEMNDDPGSWLVSTPQHFYTLSTNMLSAQLHRENTYLLVNLPLK